MAPPVYADIGKQARDVFGKGYHFGLYKLECKTKTSQGVEFTAGANQNHESAKVLGNCEIKYKLPKYGLSLVEKWNTDNILNCDLSMENQGIEGLKLTAETSFAPFTSKWSGKGKIQYKNPNIALNTDVDVLAGPCLHGALVLSHSGFLVGYQASYDSQKAKLTKSNIGVGYEAPDHIVTVTVNDGQDFNGSVYHKVNSDLEAALQVGWTSGPNSTRFAIGGKYNLDKETNVRAKINNSCQLGLGYQQKLRQGVTMTFSTQVDMKGLNQGGHKVGVCLELEA